MHINILCERLSNLQFYYIQVSLNSNQLTGSLPSLIFSSKSLETLYLFDNKFSGAIPPEVGAGNRVKHCKFVPS